MDQQLKIKSYTPDASTYAPRIRSEQWEQHKSLLSHLHSEGLKRAAMLDILRKQGFNPSLGQLNAKMTAWGFKVYGIQSESQDRGSDGASRSELIENADTTMADLLENDLTLSPALRKSVSSTTLCEPERRSGISSGDHNLTLDEVIVQQSLSLAGIYWPAVRPPDFGFKPINSSSSAHQTHYDAIKSVADFLCAVHCFEQAFDLYYHIFEHLVSMNLATDTSLVRGLIQCAISATTDAQCEYVLSILRRAHAYCAEHGMMELTSSFASLSRDLCTREVQPNNNSPRTQTYQQNDSQLHITTGTEAKLVADRKEWLQQQLSHCDETCATLEHLSAWCQDTLSFYRLEHRAIQRLSQQTGSGEVCEMTALENEFQVLARALVVDYLNSPGPSMKRANVECKETDCLFRLTLSPSTSLIVMAHLMYEPLRLQAQGTTNQYLGMRARNLMKTQWTTALQELKSFAAADSKTRCSAFVDVYMRRFNTTLEFRRFVSNINCAWDRINAAKRLTNVLQSNQTGLLPHAGLPSARRSVLKTLVAPFNADPSLTESHRKSLNSDSGSMGEFHRLATQIGQTNEATGYLTSSDAMSIDTRSSWSFTRVTGFSGVLVSGRNSLSSRKGDVDEVEEYRHFLTNNNYSHQNLLSIDSSTPTQHFALPAADRWK